MGRLVPYSGRLLPMWLLLPPTVAYSLAHYIVTTIIAQVSSRLIVFYKRFSEERNGAVSRTSIDSAGDAHREQVILNGNLKLLECASDITPNGLVPHYPNQYNYIFFFNL